MCRLRAVKPLITAATSCLHWLMPVSLPGGWLSPTLSTSAGRHWPGCDCSPFSVHPHSKKRHNQIIHHSFRFVTCLNTIFIITETLTLQVFSAKNGYQATFCTGCRVVHARMLFWASGVLASSSQGRNQRIISCLHFFFFTFQPVVLNTFNQSLTRASVGLRVWQAGVPHPSASVPALQGVITRPRPFGIHFHGPCLGVCVRESSFFFTRSNHLTDINIIRAVSWEVWLVEAAGTHRKGVSPPPPPRCSHPIQRCQPMQPYRSLSDFSFSSTKKKRTVKQHQK